MKILTFSTLYPSAARPQHGIFVETRLRHLVASGAVAARVVAPSPWFPSASPRFGTYAQFARVPARETRNGLDVDHPRYPLLPKIGMSTAPLALFAATLPLLRRQIRAGRDFDLIDAHYFYPDGVAAVLLGRALGRPVTITARGTDVIVLPTYRVPRRWIWWAAQHADGLITVSAGLKDRLVALGVAPARVRVLRNGVDLVRFQPPPDRAAARRALGFTRPTLVAVGHLIVRKQHRRIVEALAELPGVDLVIVGEGPERAAIEALARARGVADRTRLLGALPQERLPAIFGAADLSLLPSLFEGWPNVLLESMACGTPVVASGFAGVADIVAAPEAGRILTDAAPATLAAAIRAVLADPPSRAATRDYAENFDWRSTTEGQLALFREICGRHGEAAEAAAPRLTRGGVEP